MNQREQATPIASVVIPCFNAAAFVGDAVRSALDQTNIAAEVIVVDDGSTDASAAVVSAIADERLRLLRQANTGVATARNVGVAAAKGHYIGFLDADDMYEPENLSRKVAYLGANPDIGLVHSAEAVFDAESGQTLRVARSVPGPALRRLLEFSGSVIHSPSSVVVRRRTLEQAGPFDTALSTSADWEMWTRLACLTPFGYIDAPLVRYRMHPQQMHRDIRRMEHDMLYAMAKCRDGGMFNSDYHYRYCLSKVNLILAACYYADARDPRRALGRFLASVRASRRPLLERLRGVDAPEKKARNG